MQKTAIGSLRLQAGILPGPDRWRSITKILLVMKLTALLLTVTFLQAYASGSAQSVTLSGKDIPLKRVFSAIKEQTGYVVFYNQNMLAGTKPVTLTVFNMPLTDLLTTVFTDQPVNFLIQDKTIILSRKMIVEKAPEFEDILQVDQYVPINGTIKSTEGEFLYGVSVRVKNSSIGTTTDHFGNFQLKKAQDKSIIEFSAIGYETVELTVVQSGDDFKMVTAEKVSFTTNSQISKGSIYLTLNMKKSLSVLDETQIIAYGKTSRRYSTGNVGTVKGEDIRRQPVMNVLQALEGRVAGLNLSPNTGNSAAPVKVEIRGRNSLNPNALSEPLYVIDGVPQAALNSGGLIQGLGLNTGAVQAGLTNTYGENPLFYLNPRELESVDVLKDADATAIYGARGANGVILITTKRNKPGPTSFRLNIGRGTTSIQRQLKMLSTEEYLAMRREALRNDGILPDMYNAPDLTTWDQNKYTNWQDYFFTPGNTFTADAGLSGGIAQTSYGINAGYQSEEPIMNQGGKNIRANVSGNLNHTTLDQKLKFGFTSRLTVTNSDAIRGGDYIYTAPNAPDVYTEKGDFNFIPYRGRFSSLFPFGALKRVSESETEAIANNLNLSYEIIKGLIISVNAGYTFSNNDNKYLNPSASADAQWGNLSTAYFGKSSTSNWIVEPQISYNAFLGKGNLTVQVGASAQDIRNEGITTIGLMFPNDNLMKSPNNASIKQIIESSGQYKYTAIFGIINYKWDNKYIIDLNGRRDGSSKFGPGRQFGNFGSVGATWIASQEQWIKSILPSWWSFVKFSGSYGIAGGDAVGDYEFLTRWGSTPGGTPGEALLSYNGTTAYHLIAPVNQDFRWEQTRKVDVSTTLGFVQDRINVSAAYYKHKSGNQLALMPTPIYTGFGQVRVNSPAVVENSGWEVTMLGTIINTKDWQLSANFNISANKNVLVDFPGIESSNYANTYAVGYSLSSKFLYHYIGINPATGDFMVEDRNKNGTISMFGGLPKLPEDDRYIVYDLNPDYFGGFGLNVGYKDFQLSGQFVFKKQLGEDPYFNSQIGAMKNVHIPQEIKDNHWQKPGDIALYPKYTTMALNNLMRSSDRFYTDASFLKLGTLSLSYDLPAALLNKVKIKQCRFLISTQNLFTITSYKGIDPEVQDLIRGVPVYRTISTSLNFTF